VNSPEISSAAQITRDPRRLEALCELWKCASRSVWLTLTGYSMAPTLLPGTRLKVRCGVPVEKLSIGEIIVVRENDRLVIHRLVEIAKGEPGRYVCKGDNNPERDPPVTSKHIVGRVTEVRPPAALTRLRKRLGHLLLSYRRRVIAMERRK
jgi:signal peptidase I